MPDVHEIFVKVGYLHSCEEDTRSMCCSHLTGLLLFVYTINVVGHKAIVTFLFVEVEQTHRCRNQECHVPVRSAVCPQVAQTSPAVTDHRGYCGYGNTHPLTPLKDTLVSACPELMFTCVY